MGDKPYTAAEAALARYAQEAKQYADNVEQWAKAKYWVMARQGFRQMRYDTLVDPARNRATVVDQGTLIATATQTSAGQFYLREYACDPGRWYTRFLFSPAQHEIDAFRSDPQCADAFWVILGVVGVALLAGARPQGVVPEGGESQGEGDVTREPDRTNQGVELGKNVAAGADNPARRGWESADKQRREAQRDREVTEADATKADVSAVEARTEARRVRRAASAPVIVLEEYLVVSVTRFTGSPPPRAMYDMGQSRFVAVSVGTMRTARASTIGAENPGVRGAANVATRRAAAAGRDAETAYVRLAGAEVRFLNAEAFERTHTGTAGSTTAALVAMSAINLALTIAAHGEEPNLQTKVKLGGAVADVLASLEFLPVRWAARGGGTAASRWVLGARAAGVIGGGISAFFAFSDAVKAAKRGDTDLMLSSSVLGTGSLMVVLGSFGIGAAGTFGTMGVLSAISLTGIGLVPAIVGAGLLFVFANPPVEDWIKGCEWGIDPDGKPVAKQLKDLVQMLSMPALTAHVYAGTAANLPAGVRGPGVRAVLRPPFFVVGETVISGELEVRHVSVPTGFTGEGRSGLPRRSRVTRERFSIDLSVEAQHALRAGRSVYLSNRGGLRAVVNPGEQSPTFEFYLPVGRKLESSRGGVFEPLTFYECTGSAHVQLWEHHEHSAWRGVRLDPVNLPAVQVEGTDR